MQSAVKQSRIKYVITSRRFLQKTERPDLNVRWLYLENLLKNLGKLERFRAARVALLSAPSRLADGREPQPNDDAAIIFSSSTTGTSKGVVLSHANLLSNVGEMIPHGAVEDTLQQASGAKEPCVAVVGKADETKGEQLAVCYTGEAGDPERLISKLRKLDLPNLWIPRAANFVRIESLPILGTGKLDLCTLNTLVNS